MGQRESIGREGEKGEIGGRKGGKEGGREEMGGNGRVKGWRVKGRAARVPPIIASHLS